MESTGQRICWNNITEFT